MVIKLIWFKIWYYFGWGLLYFKAARWLGTKRKWDNVWTEWPKNDASVYDLYAEKNALEVQDDHGDRYVYFNRWRSRLDAVAVPPLFDPTKKTTST